MSVLVPSAMAVACNHPLFEERHANTGMAQELPPLPPSPTDSMSFQSCNPSDSISKEAGSVITELPLRVRNENVQHQPPKPREVEFSRSESAHVPEDQPPHRRPSTRSTKSIRTVLTFRDASSERDTKPRLPVPSPNDPVLAQAVENSIDLAKRERSASTTDSTKPEDKASEPSSNPFQRWVKTLHKRSLSRQGALKPRQERWSLDDFDESAPVKRPVLRHKKSDSWPSSVFLTAVRSAKLSLTTLGEPSQSSKVQGPPPALGRFRAGRRSHSFSRNSMDSSIVSVQVFDEASRTRAVKRRQILEELVMTEEQYIADLKMLLSVSNILGSEMSP